MKVIIVGGGFGGLKLARNLSNKKGIEILLIDKFNYHQFQPLFYQVATAGLDASNIAFPLRKAFQHSKNIRIRVTDLKEIVAAENKIITGRERSDTTYWFLLPAPIQTFLGTSNWKNMHFQ
jgi:NADH dehydrogenase